MKNEYGQSLDANGYAPSIMQSDLSVCWRCGRSHEKLDRHELWGGALRSKSKRLGVWVMLCHQSCHLDGVHKYAKEAERLRIHGQRIAMKTYGWDKEKFIKEFGKNYVE